MTVRKLVTDRHTQVSAYVTNEKPEVDHAYDVWHVAKGIVYMIAYKVLDNLSFVIV